MARGPTKTKPGTRRRWTETEAREMLDAWARSGESEHAFARRHSMSRQRLRYWRSRLAVPAASVTSRPAFVAVSMPTIAQPKTRIEVRVGAVSLCIREDIDVEYLARIVGALARLRPC